MAAKKLWNKFLILFSSIILKFMNNMNLNVIENGFEKARVLLCMIPSFQKSSLIRSIHKVVKF